MLSYSFWPPPFVVLGQGLVLCASVPQPCLLLRSGRSPDVSLPMRSIPAWRIFTRLASDWTGDALTSSMMSLPHMDLLNYKLSRNPYVELILRYCGSLRSAYTSVTIPQVVP